MSREKIIQYMISSYNSVNEKDAELVLEEIFDKVEKNIDLEEQEEKFLNQYFLNYYRYNVGGDLYPYPKYEKKLKPIYKRIADYYTIHQDKNTYESAVFLQYYYLVEMSRDYEIKPFVGVGDEAYFAKKPDACAYHRKEQISQNITRPIICYNPKYIKEWVEKKQILELIDTGFHELEHEVQDMEIDKEKIDNAQAIIWAKEKLAREVVGNVFYNGNYEQYFYERDARYFAQKRIEKILLDLNCDMNSYSIPQNWTQNNKYDTTIIFKDVENQDDEILAIDLLESISTNYIKIYHSIFLKKYPVLKTIYDDKGNKKLLSQIESELEERKKEEISKYPKETRKIEQKYNSLLYKICQTDNDLKMQYLCMDAAFYEAEDDKIALSTKLNQIKMLTKSRAVSYESLIGRIEAKLSELDRKIRKNHDYNSLERSKLVAAYKSTLELKKCVLKYNIEFKEKYTSENVKKQIKRNLETILGTKIDRYKFIVDENGNVFAENKDKEELDEQYKEHVRLLTTKTTTREEFDEYFEKLSTAYDDLYKELEQSKKVPNR